MSTTTPAARRPRADALRNREKVLAAAAEVFAEQGTDASLEEVARRAGVGVGTLYRHFPTRAALVEHVYRDGVARLAAQARELVETRPVEEALTAWVLAFADYAGRKRDNAAALRAALGDDSAAVFADSRAQLTEAADMHDQVRAKLHKALGYVAEKGGDGKAALEHLCRALELDSRAGVKQDIARLEKAGIAAGATVNTAADRT